MSALAIMKEMGGIEGFRSAAAHHPIARGLPAGTITDDTQQTLLLAQILLQSYPHFDHQSWADSLMRWEKDIKEAGGYDLLGPSTKRALEAINRGVAPQEAGRYGDTNGAAMRIAPVGIACPLYPLKRLVARVHETCQATHNTQLAIASASAVAAAISAGIEGRDYIQATRIAIEAARLGKSQGFYSAGADVAARIEWACALVRDKERHQASDAIVDLVGTSLAAQESIPAAFAVLTVVKGDVWQAAVMSANLGGDTDTIGAIACAIAGACCGYHVFKEAPINKLRGFDIGKAEHLAHHLLSLRFAHHEGDDVS